MLLLNEEEADDLLYCSRAGELDEMKTFIEAILARADVRSSSDANAAFNQLMTDVAHNNEGKNTILHFSAANGHTDVISYLVPQCDLKTLLCQNSSGNTPLHWASLNGHLQIAQILVERIDALTPSSPPKDYTRLTPEEKEAEEEREAQKRSVWDIVNSVGRGPMSEGQLNGQDKVVTFLLDHMIAGAGKPAEPVGIPEESDSVQKEGLEEQPNSLSIAENGA